MIITLTMNPALDKSTVLEKMIPEKKMRCGPIQVEAGGGGINVSKAIRELGGTSTAVFPTGGINGRKMEQLLLQLQITCKTIPVKGETRESFNVMERVTNAEYRFIMPGAELDPDEQEQCLQAVRDLAAPDFILVASGSLPPGVPDDFPARMAALVREKKGRFIIDTSGKPLMKAIEQGVYLLKPNLSELCSLVGTDYLQLTEIEGAAKKVISRGGCEVMVVSMGPAGALLVTKEEVKHINTPPVKKQSAVGAGDSMVAGLVWMLEQNKSMLEAVQFGVACGSAATMSKGTQLFRKEDVYKLFDWIKKDGS